MNFGIIRLMVAAAWVRLVLRKETWLECMTALDKALLVWVAVGTVIYALRLSRFDALVSRLGGAYDVIGLFFVFRFSIRGYEDLRMAIRALAIVIGPLMLLMCVEKLTGLNPFSIFGGVPEHTWFVRGERLRVQGPFRHPITAGTFGATLFPLFAALWCGGKSRERVLSMIGILSSSMIVVLTASSGPVIAYSVALLSCFLWRFRKKVKTLWYLFFMALIALNAIMKAPIWFLIARMSDVLGGTGWHRSMLIDQAIRHFSEWWLAGTSYTAHWMPYVLASNPNMADITNQFILEGVDGGILTLSAFVFLVAIAFRTLGQAVRAGTSDPKEERVIWGLWGSLLAHVATFFSITYFDQMLVFWFLLLACISVVGTRISPVRRPFTKVVLPSSGEWG